MIKIDSIDKAFAYSVGRLDLETGEIGGEKVNSQLSKMQEHCKLYGKNGEKRQDVCPNYLNCRYHPIPSDCTIKMTKSLILAFDKILDKNS